MEGDEVRKISRWHLPSFPPPPRLSPRLEDGFQRYLSPPSSADVRKVSSSLAASTGICLSFPEIILPLLPSSRSSFTEREIKRRKPTIALTPASQKNDQDKILLFPPIQTLFIPPTSQLQFFCAKSFLIAFAGVRQATLPCLPYQVGRRKFLFCASSPPFSHRWGCEKWSESEVSAQFAPTWSLSFNLRSTVFPSLRAQFSRRNFFNLEQLRRKIKK